MSSEKSKPQVHIGCGGLLFLLVIAVLAGGFLLKGLGVRPWVGVPLFFGAVVVFALLLIAFNPQARRQWSNLLRFVFRAVPAIDRRAVARAADGSISEEMRGPFTIWTDRAGGLPIDFESEGERVRAEFAALTGLPSPELKPIRVIAFQHSAGFHRYAGGLLGNLELASFYLKHLVCRIAVSIEATELSSTGGMRSLASQLLCYHLIFTRYGRTQYPWIQEGLACRVRDQINSAAKPPGTQQRYFLSEQDRGTFLPPAALLGRRATDLVDYGDKPPTPADSIAALRRFSEQSAALVTFLANERRREFGAYLEPGKLKPLTPESFEHSFGISIDEAVDAAIVQVLDAPLPAYQAPPEELRIRIDNEWTPLLLDDKSPAVTRRMLLRNFGSSGYPWGAAALIRLADDDLCDVQPDALYAIEQLAGRSFRNDRNAMAAWYADLPDKVKSPAIDPLGRA